MAALSLLDRGMVFAVAHVRGGGELGRRWYLDGKLLQKRNTFTDFVACAEHLIAEGWTSADRLAIRGGSAGGLLVGAAMNLRPDLFASVVAEVPFVDVVNSMLDESLPLTVAEWEEWGNPNDEEYDLYMSSYAPYENVAAVAVPRDLRDRGLQRPTRELPRAGEVGRASARDHHGVEAAAAEDRDGRRARRQVRALRRLARGSRSARVHPHDARRHVRLKIARAINATLRATDHHVTGLVRNEPKHAQGAFTPRAAARTNSTVNATRRAIAATAA